MFFSNICPSCSTRQQASKHSHILYCAPHLYFESNFTEDFMVIEYYNALWVSIHYTPLLVQQTECII